MALGEVFLIRPNGDALELFIYNENGFDYTAEYVLTYDRRIIPLQSSYPPNYRVQGLKTLN